MRHDCRLRVVSQKPRGTAHGVVSRNVLPLRYELKSNRARIAPIAPNSEQGQKPLKNKGKSKANRSLSPQTTTETAQETAQENLSAEESRILDYIKANATITRKVLSEKLGISSDSVKRRLDALKAKLGLHHEGPTKKGRWVFGPKPSGTGRG